MWTNKQIKQFTKWIKSKNRHPYIYHVGCLFWSNNSHKEFPLAKAAWDAYKNGSVLLVQRKCAIGKYKYIAIKKRRIKYWGAGAKPIV